MARYNEILVGRLNRALQKFLSMKGGPPSPQLAGDIGATFSFPIGTEFRYLETWNRYSISSNGPAEVGGVTPVRYRLRNPPGSNVVGVLESLIVSTNVVAGDNIVFTLGASPGNLPTVLTPQRLDARIQSGTGTLVPSTDTSGGPDSPQIGIAFLNPGNGSFQVIGDSIQEITVLPGDTFGISQQAVAAGSLVRWWVIWRERLLEESERF